MSTKNTFENIIVSEIGKTLYPNILDVNTYTLLFDETIFVSIHFFSDLLFHSSGVVIYLSLGQL